MMPPEFLHIETPLIESVPLSTGVQGNVWLKMEALQPSGSFKLRGIGYACQEYLRQGAKRFISSSGGNAGVAVAYAGRKLGVPVTVVVPKTTSQTALEVLRHENAQVKIHGKIWQDAHEFAVQLAAESNAAYLHPFDNPLIWTGHATLIDEVRQSGIEPDVVVLSVGGDGLLCGIIEGLRRNNMADVPILAVETEGADSLAASLRAGQHVELEDIQSIATTLGAKKVASAAYQWCDRHEVASHVVSDRAAVAACLRFSQDHRLLVEPACGASLSALYDEAEFLSSKQNILVIVCGGVSVTISQLEQWKRALNAH